MTKPTATHIFFNAFGEYMAMQKSPQPSRDIVNYYTVGFAYQGRTMAQTNDPVYPPLNLKVRDHKEMKRVRNSVVAYIEELGLLRLGTEIGFHGRIFYTPVDEQLGTPAVLLVIKPETISDTSPVDVIYYYGTKDAVASISEKVADHLVDYDVRRVAEVKAVEKAALAQPWLDGMRTSIALMMGCGVSIVSEQPADGPQHPDLLTANQQVPQGDFPPSPTGAYYVDPKFMPQPIQGDSNAQQAS